MIRFEIGEKVFLQKLILKYKIHTKVLNSTDRAHRKKAWILLAEEFNSTNGYNRTTAQLRKCWHNIKDRARKPRGLAPGEDEGSQRSALARELGLGLGRPLPRGGSEDRDWEPPAEPDSSSDSDKEFEVAEESMGAAASPPRAPPRPAAEALRPPTEEDSPAASESDASRPSSGAKRRRSGDRAPSLPGVPDTPDVDQRARERTEELHKLKVAERVWTLKTLRERHATAQLERQRAQDESERAKLLRETAECERERALLELQQFKQSTDNIK